MPSAVEVRVGLADARGRHVKRLAIPGGCSFDEATGRYRWALWLMSAKKWVFPTMADILSWEELDAKPLAPNSSILVIDDGDDPGPDPRASGLEARLAGLVAELERELARIRDVLRDAASGMPPAPSPAPDRRMDAKDLDRCHDPSNRTKSR